MNEVLRYRADGQWVNGPPPNTSYPYTGVFQGGPCSLNIEEPWWRNQPSVSINPNLSRNFRSDRFGDVDSWIGREPNGAYGFLPGASGRWLITIGWLQGAFSNDDFRFSIWSPDPLGTKDDFPHFKMEAEPGNYCKTYLFDYDNLGTDTSKIEVTCGGTLDFRGAWTVIRRLQDA